MSRHLIENHDSFSGISGIGHHDSLINEIGSNRDMLYTIKINGPTSEGLSLGPMSAHLREQEQPQKCQKSISHKSTFNLESTGYDINRDLYSEQQIRQAFQVIDINNDGMLSFDDLSFFMRCMDEEFTPEEVHEMISIVSNNPKGVLPEDFKKVAKGKFVPFAGMHAPGPNAPRKQAVLSNLIESGLIDVDPDDLLLSEEANIISHAKFEADKSHRFEEIEPEEIESVEQEAPLLRNRTMDQIRQKRKDALCLSMLNVQQIIEKVGQCGKDYVDSREIADLLTINESHARQLFTESYRRILSHQLILDAILFSSKPPLQRLELILNNYSKGPTLTFQAWLDILVYMLGSDLREQVRRRLSRLLADKKPPKNAQFDKYYIIHIMTKEHSSFNWP